MKRAREGEENDVSNVKRFKQDTDDPQDPKPVVQELTEDEQAKKDALDLLETLQLEDKRPSCELVIRVLGAATKLLGAEPNLLKLSSPITCVGDIHAEWYDLKKVFELAGSVDSGSRFIFLGDYVDRGFYGVECLVSLAARKILFPNGVFLIRGNHEDSNISSTYGHKQECEIYYSGDVYDASVEFFKSLPLCATVDSKYFCCHGGPPHEMALTEIESINRSIQSIDTNSSPQGVISDLLWSDPGDNPGAMKNPVVPNTPRGCGSLFNETALRAWHDANGIQLTIRAHQLANTGVFWNPGFNKTLVTVFSASDYCRQMGNDGGVLQLFPDRPPQEITWTPEDIGVRAKIFGRDSMSTFFSTQTFGDQESDSESDDSWDEPSAKALGELLGAKFMALLNGQARNDEDSEEEEDDTYSESSSGSNSSDDQIEADLDAVDKALEMIYNKAEKRRKAEEKEKKSKDGEEDTHQAMDTSENDIPTGDETKDQKTEKPEEDKTSNGQTTTQDVPPIETKVVAEEKTEDTTKTNPPADSS